MSVCLGCGGSFDDSFGFCPYCGRAKPKPEAVEVNVNISYADKWETCRIARYSFSQKTDRELETATDEGYFWADAIGPQGSYGAGQSPIYKTVFKWNKKTEKWGIQWSGMRTSYDFLIGQLVKDGWESAGSGGSDWWQGQFRRRLGQNCPPPFLAWEVFLKGKINRAWFVLRGGPHRQDTTPVERYQSNQFKTDLQWFVRWDIEKPERTRILHDFLEDLERKGYQVVSNSEQLKDCYWQGEQDRTLWYFRILLERL